MQHYWRSNIAIKLLLKPHNFPFFSLFATILYQIFENNFGIYNLKWFRFGRGWSGNEAERAIAKQFYLENRLLFAFFPFSDVVFSVNFTFSIVLIISNLKPFFTSFFIRLNIVHSISNPFCGFRENFFSFSAFIYFLFIVMRDEFFAYGHWLMIFQSTGGNEGREFKHLPFQSLLPLCVLIRRKFLLTA